MSGAIYRGSLQLWQRWTGDYEYKDDDGWFTWDSLEDKINNLDNTLFKKDRIKVHTKCDSYDCEYIDNKD